MIWRKKRSDALSVRSASFPSVVQLSSLDGTNGFAIPGSGGAFFGGGVAGVGDINGDGFADIVVGVSGADPAGRTDAGQAYAIFGQATFPATVYVSSLNGSNGFTINGAAAGDGLGGSISPAGDVNGDGIADVLIGASGVDAPGLVNVGGAYVVYGKNTGMSGQFPATFEIASLDGTTGFALQGFVANGSVGNTIRAAGDVDGDGFADILISSSYGNGQDFLVFGGPGRGTNLPLAGLLAANGGDGSSGVAFNGIAGGSLKAAGIGDINGDGFADMRFGSSYVPVNGNAWAGQAYIVFGKPTVPGIRVTPTLGLVTSESGGSAVFNVVLRTAPTSAVTIPISSSDTTEGAVSISSLTFTPANWRVPQTVTITGVDDTLTDGDIAYSIVLGAATSNDSAYSGLNPSDVSVTNLDNDTKFYVVDDASTDRTYEYTASGGSVENYPLNGGDSAPRGAAITAAGSKVWVVDKNKNVYVYNTSGGLLGSWAAGSLPGNAAVEGIATNGTDIWIVDSQGAKVYRYTGAATRLLGSQNAASNFSLNSGNTSPKDIVTDGTNLWVVNDSTTDKVFKYTLSGSLVGSWTISGAGSSPTGITLDPSVVANMWVVDSGTKRVYQFDNAAGRTSGSQSPSTIFALAAGNTNPQGIADPPVPTSGASQVATLNRTFHPSGHLAAHLGRAIPGLQVSNSSGSFLPLPAGRSSGVVGQETPILMSLIPSTDQDITLLAADLLRTGTKRSRSVLARTNV
jgi:hypothetical protein